MVLCNPGAERLCFAQSARTSAPWAAFFQPKSTAALVVCSQVASPLSLASAIVASSGKETGGFVTRCYKLAILQKVGHFDPFCFQAMRRSVNVSKHKNSRPFSAESLQYP